MLLLDKKYKIIYLKYIFYNLYIIDLLNKDFFFQKVI